MGIDIEYLADLDYTVHKLSEKVEKVYKPASVALSTRI